MGGWFGDEGVGFGSATFAEMRDRGLAREQPISIAPTPTLTPSDVTLSKMLAAYDEWTGGEDNQSADILGELSEVMVERGLLDIERALTLDGAALLDRARKAGVL